MLHDYERVESLLAKDVDVLVVDSAHGHSNNVLETVRKIKQRWTIDIVAGDIDLNGILGLDPSVRNGYEQITVRFSVKGDATPEQLASLVEQSRARSAVYDVITNAVPIRIEVETP